MRIWAARIEPNPRFTSSPNQFVVKIGIINLLILSAIPREPYMKPFAVIMFCVLLASCATRPQPYVEPTEGPVATINFINKSKRTAVPRIYENHETCSGAYFADFQSIDAEIEVKVKAESPLSISYGLYELYL